MPPELRARRACFDAGSAGVSRSKVPGAGHSPMVDSAAEFNERLADFLFCANAPAVR